MTWPNDFVVQLQYVTDNVKKSYTLAGGGDASPASPMVYPRLVSRDNVKTPEL
jgi:hypothetical protein